MRHYRPTDWTTAPQILDHVLIYVLTVPVLYLYVCVCVWCACVRFCCTAFFAF